MKIVLCDGGAELVREPCDEKLHRETDVTRHMVRLLNERDPGCWMRCRPYKLGLTSCTQGFCRKSLKCDVYWHERYAVEMAHKAFNEGSVFYQRSAWHDA